MQLTFGAVRDPEDGHAWTGLLDAIAAAIHSITPKELCFALNIKASYLSDALRGVDRKGIRLEWLPTILALAPAGDQMAIVSELAAMCGLEVVLRKTRTPEEELRLTRELMGRYAPLLLREIDKELHK